MFHAFGHLLGVLHASIALFGEESFELDFFCLDALLVDQSPIVEQRESNLLQLHLVCISHLHFVLLELFV